MKAILILDEKPESCMECDYCNEFGICKYVGNVGEAFERGLRYIKCPLKQLPQEKEEVFPPINIEKDDGVKNFIKPVYLKDLFKYAVAKGYNKCLDEILGGGEKL